MALYLIYKRIDGLQPTLYAITDKKWLKDDFMSERKSSMFIVMKKELKLEQSDKFLMYNNNYVLGRRGYETSSSNGYVITRTNVFITSTLAEEMSVIIESDRAIIELAKNTDSYSKYFNNELINALNTLNYFEIYKFKEDKYELYKDSYFESVTPFDGYKNGKYCIDSYGVFMMLYGNTIDISKITKGGK